MAVKLAVKMDAKGEWKQRMNLVIAARIGDEEPFRERCYEQPQNGYTRQQIPPPGIRVTPQGLDAPWCIGELIRS